MSSQGGHQFAITLPDLSVQEITPTKPGGTLNGDINDPNLNIAWSVQAGDYWILQDNLSLPIIWNGSVAVRSDQSKQQVPVGNIMCFCQGRLAVSLTDFQTFRIGDLIFGASGTPALGYADAVLYFTENNYYNEGGDFVARIFAAPSNSGPITSMSAGAMGDTALGQGPLVVGTPYVVFTCQLPFDRTTWKDLTQAQQTANPIIGPLGQDSTIQVNTDLWYRGIDGIRSYKTAQAQFNGSWGNTPKSAEIGDVLSGDTDDLLQYGSAVLFDNRILMTVSPVNSQYGVWHRGLAVIDLNLISGLRINNGPSWEGIWSGPRILKIIKLMVGLTERCFIYNLNDSNQIDVWELTTGDKFDHNGTDDLPINWAWESRSYVCGSNDAFKRLETGRLIISGLTGTLNGTVKYRTDDSPCWQSWTTFAPCAKYQDCGPPDCFGPHTYREQSRQPLRYNMPPDAFDPISGRKYRTGYEFAVRHELSGYAQIRAFRIYTLSEPDSLSPNRNET